jgi:hypothetical protein
MNSSFGSNVFTGNSTSSQVVNYFWPHGASVGDNIYFIDVSNVLTSSCSLKYSRSTDGGVTWIQDHDSIATLDSQLMSSTKSDSYFLDAKGNIVSFVVGGYGNPLVMWKSNNSGVSFNRIIIDSFPGIAFPTSLDSLMDFNNDGIADTALVNAGSVTCLIDNNNLVHVWYTAYKVASDISNNNILGIVDFPNTYLMYWNESMSHPQIIDQYFSLSHDCNGDGVISVASNTFQINQGARYGGALTLGHPQSGIDNNGRLFLVYDCIMEQDSTTSLNPLNQGLDAQNFRDIFVKFSTNNGASWSPPINITQTWQEEDVYPSIARFVDTALHIIYQSDFEPGTAIVDQDAVYSNNIKYSSINKSWLLQQGNNNNLSCNSNVSPSYATINIRDYLCPNTIKNYYGISFNTTGSFYHNVRITTSSYDSIISLHVVLLNGKRSSTIYDTACAKTGYWFNNQLINSTGVYYDTIVSMLTGCDSIVTLNLNVFAAPSTQAIFGQTSITPFQSYVYAINQVAGINYTWTATNGVIQNGQGTNSVTVMWGNSGPYQLQLIQTSGGGCSDTTYLSVANSSCVINYNIQVIANTVYCAGDTVKLVAQTSTSGVNYQWTNNSQNIVGATNDTLIITQSGTYQLLMTFGSCAVLSSVYPITFNPKPSPPQIQSAGWNNLCATQQITLSTTSAYASYLWSNGQTSATINVNQSGNYSVIGFNAFGCGASSSITPISLSLAPSYNICMVTVDSATSSNKVVWEKPSKRGVDSFYILKESNVLNVYNNIGRVGVNDSSIYVDLNSVPQQHADRYEIAVKDSCGNISLPSAPHKTMHLTINQGLGGVWNLIWTPYEGMSFNTYDIYRANSAGQYQLIGSVSAANTSFTDINPPSFVLNYKVAITHPGGCSPSSKGSSQSYTQTSSNIVSIDNTNGLRELAGINLSVYPNPNDGYFNISFTDKTYRTIELLNVLGQVVYSVNTDEAKLAINKSESALAKGVYTLHVVQGTKQANVRIVVE